jgi:hypothetical protein
VEYQGSADRSKKSIAIEREHVAGRFGASFMYMPKMAEAQVHPEPPQHASYTASIGGQSGKPRAAIVPWHDTTEGHM